MRLVRRGLFPLCWLFPASCELVHIIIKIPLTELQHLHARRRRLRAIPWVMSLLLLLPLIIALLSAALMPIPGANAASRPAPQQRTRVTHVYAYVNFNRFDARRHDRAIRIRGDIYLNENRDRNGTWITYQWVRSNGDKSPLISVNVSRGHTFNLFWLSRTSLLSNSAVCLVLTNKLTIPHPIVSIYFKKILDFPALRGTLIL